MSPKPPAESGNVKVVPSTRSAAGPSWTIRKTAESAQSPSGPNPKSNRVEYHQTIQTEFGVKNSQINYPTQYVSANSNAKSNLKFRESVGPEARALENVRELTELSRQAIRSEKSDPKNLEQPALKQSKEISSSSDAGRQQPTNDNLQALFQVLAKLNYDLSVSVDRANGLQQVLNRISQFCNADFAALVGSLSDPLVESSPFSNLRRQSIKVLATSSAASIDQSGQLVKVLETAAADCLDHIECNESESQQGVPNTAPEQQKNDAVFCSSEQKFLNTILDSTSSKECKMVAINGDAKNPLFLILASNSESQESHRNQAILESLPMLLRPVLANLAKIHQNGWARLLQWPVASVGKNWKTFLAAFIGLVGLCALPWPYTMNCECSLHTDQRRYAVAPFKGKLKEVFAKPGSDVAEGDLLAKMDDQELLLQLKSLESDLAKEKQIALAEKAAGDFGKARISELKYRQLQNEIQLAKHKLQNLEVRANIAGTVVQGEIEHLTGAPVDIGQNLLEVAPLDSLVVQIEIPEYQIRYVNVDQNVRLKVEAYPYQTWTAKVLRIQPQAVVRNHSNVFLAEVELENKDHRLQPGMKGRAKIVGDSYPLAWNWLHYPYERLRLIAGWF